MPLSVHYPLVELITGFIFVGVYWYYPFLNSDLQTNGFQIQDYANLARALHAVIFCCLLLVCSVIDMHLMIIPDVLSLPMIALTPVVVYLHPDLEWQSALIGVVAGGFSLYAVAWIYWIVRKEIGMGMGDVKLLAGIGGWTMCWGRWGRL